jgi:hypothetical protein
MAMGQATASGYLDEVWQHWGSNALSQRDHFQISHEKEKAPESTACYPGSAEFNLPS